MTIHLDSDYFAGEKFVIETTGNAPGELRCTAAAQFNGRRLETFELTHADITAGGTLHLMLEG